MVRSLVDFCVRRSVPVTLLMWTLLIGGAVALASMRREFFPETAPQAARIVLVYPGASPKEIEESMARKIEDRVVDVEGVDRIARSFGADALVCDTHESVGPVLAALLDRRMSFSGRRG